MSTWVEGRRYSYYGEPLLCVRRYFEGPLELVDLCFAEEVAVVGMENASAVSPVFTRTARTLAPCVLPRVTETLGGVTRPESCHHDWYGRVTADAGPHAGQSCCEACGTPP